MDQPFNHGSTKMCVVDVITFSVSRCLLSIFEGGPHVRDKAVMLSSPTQGCLELGALWFLGLTLLIQCFLPDNITPPHCWILSCYSTPCCVLFFIYCIVKQARGPGRWHQQWRNLQPNKADDQPPTTDFGYKGANRIIIDCIAHYYHHSFKRTLVYFMSTSNIHVFFF